MKKLTALLLILTTILTCIPFFPASTKADTFDPTTISTPYIILMDGNSGNILFEKNSKSKAYPASTTKIMTAILALERMDDLDGEFTIETVTGSGSKMGIVKGETLKFRDLLYGMMLVSGNDAAHAIAQYACDGTEASFVELMNKKASELGMEGTHFVKSNGLHDENHYSTAYDMALLTKYALTESPKSEIFRTIVSTKTYTVAPTNKNANGYTLENTNKLLYTKKDKASFEYEYAIGVKTGDTKEAGRCLIAAAEKDGRLLICGLFGDIEGQVDGDNRFRNAAALFEYGFSKMEKLSVSELLDNTTFTETIANASYSNNTATFHIDENAYITGMGDFISELKDNKSNITIRKNYDIITAPITQGQVIGTVSIIYNGNEVGTADVISDMAVEEAGTSSDPNNSPLVNEVAKEGKGWSFLTWVLFIMFLFVVIMIIRVITLSSKKNRRSTSLRGNYPRRPASRPRRRY